MKLVKGRTLADLLAARADPSAELPRYLDIFAKVCATLAYAHSKGVIHRDLKPANVMVGNFGEVQVMDWGLAKVLPAERQAGPGPELPEPASTVRTLRTGAGGLSSQEGAVLGTLAYMPPEQALGQVETLDERADVFGLGAILCEILTGQPPYVAPSWEVHLLAASGDLAGAWARLDGCRADPELVRLAKDCLARRRDDRPRDAGLVAEAVAAYQTSVQERLRQAEVERATAARAREEKARATAAAERRVRRLSVALVAVLLLGIGVALAFGIAAVRQADEAHDERGKAVQAREVAETEKANADEERGKAEQSRQAAEREKTKAEEAQQSEKQQRERAERLKGEAEAARQKAEAEHERAEWLLYARQLSLAQAEWEAGRAAAAWQHLEATRWDLRGWEYNYLYTLFNRGQQTLRGHVGYVIDVAFSPDGKRIASVSWDRTVQVWDVQKGQAVLILRASVESVAFSPDGQRLAGASRDKTVKVWDAHTGQELLCLNGHTDQVLSVAFSPDGQRLASASWDKTVKVWDVHKGQQGLSLTGHQGAVTSVVFSPDGQRLATGSADRTVKVWDALDGHEILSVAGHTDKVSSVAFSPDGQRIASASASLDKINQGGTIIQRLTGEVKVWDAQKGQQILALTGHTRDVSSVAFSPDGQRIAAGGFDQTVKVWDAQQGQLLLSLKGHTHCVTSVVFSPDGRHIASASLDNTVKVWDVRTDQKGRSSSGPIAPVYTVPSPDCQRIALANLNGTVTVRDAEKGQMLLSLTGHTRLVYRLAFSLDGRRIATASDDRTVRVWNAHTGQQLLSLGGRGTLRESVAFSPDGQRLASVSSDKTVEVWDTQTGQRLLSLTGPKSDVSNLVFSPDGQRLAGTSRDGTVRVWDAHKGQQVLSWTDWVDSLVFSPDGQRIATAGGGRTVKVRDAHNGQLLLSLDGHTNFTISVAFSADGQRLATTGLDETVKVWHADTGQLLLSLAGNTHGRADVAFSSDGQRLASASSHGTVRVWDAHLRQQTLSLTGHAHQVTSAAFSADGRRLASGSKDQTVRVWDIQKGQQLLSLTGHRGVVTSVAFSPDSQRLASASEDGIAGTVRMWDVQKGHQLHSLAGHTGPVTSVAFSSDGQQVWAQDRNYEILVWDSTTGLLLPKPLAAMSAAFREATTPKRRFRVSAYGPIIRLQRLSPNGQFVDDSVAQPGFYDFDPDLHLRLAGEAEDDGNTFTAAFHVGWLLRHRPHDAALHVRQAHLLAALGRRQQSALHLMHALFLHPRAPLVAGDPGAVARGEEAAQAGDWLRAGRAFERAAQQPEASAGVLANALLAHTAAGDEAARRRALATLLRRLETEKDSGQRTRLLFRALEVPSDPGSARVLLAFAAAEMERQRNADTLHCHGAALFRAGRHVEAARVLAESVQAHGKGGYYTTRLFQAMTARQLGQHGQARDLLKWVERWYVPDPFLEWQIRVRMDVLLKEARQVVEGPPPMPRLSERE